MFDFPSKEIFIKTFYLLNKIHVMYNKYSSVTKEELWEESVYV